MIFNSQIALSVAVGVTVPFAMSLPSASVAAQGRAASLVEGSWTGQFAQADWTFEFTREGNAWSGRYMSSRHNRWHALQSLIVSRNAVRFSIRSEPLVSFDLEVDASNNRLSGDVTIGEGVNIPFSAERRP